MDDTIKKFFELRDMYWESKDVKSFIFLKHILVYFYEYRNVLENGYSEELSIPGHHDLVKADSVLSSLGYRKYSITYKNYVNGKPFTEIIFRNTL